MESDSPFTGWRDPGLPAFDFLPYSAAKAAMNHMMLGLAHYFAKKVRINTILIGTVLTPGYADAGLDAAVLSPV